jgi:beta-phosphoglucomutase
MKDRIKAIIFDCDGTLVDSENAHYLAWKIALSQKGYELQSEDHLIHVGTPDRLIAEYHAKHLRLDDAEQLLDQKHNNYAELLREGIPPIQATLEFVHLLAAQKQTLGLKLGVASGAPKANILAHLRHLGIEDYFDLVLSGIDDLKEYHDPEGTNKPKPYIYQKMANLLGLAPAQCVAIEDSRPGLTAAVDAGYITVAIPHAFSKHQDFSSATLKLDSLQGFSVDDFLKKICQQL